MKKSATSNGKHIFFDSELVSSAALVEFLSCLHGFIIELPTWRQSWMACVFGIASVHVDMFFIHVAVKDWMEPSSLLKGLCPHYSVYARSVILHYVPEPNSKGNFVSRWTLTNLSHYGPDNRVAIKLPS